MVIVVSIFDIFKVIFIFPVENDLLWFSKQSFMQNQMVSAYTFNNDIKGNARNHDYLMSIFIFKWSTFCNNFIMLHMT